MKNYLKAYSDQNPEKFNKDFILSRKDDEILEYVTDIFKALEILNEIEILEITLHTDESEFGPIRSQRSYYKPILPSRLNKIHYKIKVTPSEKVQNVPILVDNEEIEDFAEQKIKMLGDEENSFIIERDLYINKIIDNSFYINEGIRYFLIYQIVDNSTYGTKNAVSLKSLLMPITVKRGKEKIDLQDYFDNSKEFFDLPKYQVLLFNKNISPFLYVMGKYAYNSLVTMTVNNREKIVEERENYKDEKMITYFNEFFGVDFRFSSDPEQLREKGRVVFEIKSKLKSLYISVDEQKLIDQDVNVLSILGSIFDSELIKKKKLNFDYDDMITPWFWIDKLSVFFTGVTDPTKKFEKIKTMLISLDRLMDEATRKILNLDKEDKANTLNVIRYILRNFDNLSREDNQDLDNKRVRIYEYMLYPLRKYFSDHIYRVLNSTTRSAAILQRIFSNLNPMYIIKQTVVNELLRYYNSTNEMNLYSCLLKYTFRGPQSINKTVSVNQRDVHPSYTGRLSLVASSASDPGISGTIVPFVEVEDYYFNKKESQE